MRHHILIARPSHISHGARQLPISTPAHRIVKLQETAAPAGRLSIKGDLSPQPLGFQVDPYIDYGRYLTDEGGVLFLYKDIDDRYRHTIWRLFAWTLFTGLEAIYLAPYSPVEDHWIEIASLFAIAVVNFFIVKKPVELYRRIEIRPDCMILEGRDVFWSRHMEGGFPTFQRGDDGDQLLCGIYGTRFVEYLTVHRFDDNDRMFEVLAAHLQDVIQQQWSRPR